MWIIRKLAEEGRVVSSDIAALFQISHDTIRRDLRHLAAAGHCRRVYGGALALSPASTPIARRVAEVPDRKARLATAVAALVRDEVRVGGVVFLDAGSTNLAIARVLPADRGLTIVTNAPAIAGELMARPGLETLLIGGRVDPQVGGALGAAAIRDASRIRADLAIIGACALSAEAGLGAFHFEDAEFKRTLAASATAVATAVTSDKLGCGAPFGVLEASALAHAIVEADAPRVPLAAVQAAGVCIHTAAS